MGAKFDFSGWATRNDLKCSDGRTIRRDAFKHNDGQTVPLVWNHQHNESYNVLGHALLENRNEGVYAYCTFNDTEAGQNAKLLVQHGDITNLSIYANHLKQKGGDVLHGAIREVSLVLAGANPGAFIDSVLAHGEESDEEAIIYTDEFIDLKHSDLDDDDEDDEENEYEESEEVEEDLEHADSKEEKDMPGAGKEETVQDVFDTLNEKQKTVVYALIGQALQDAGVSPEGEDENMKHNVFDSEVETNVLSHADIEDIFSDAKRYGSLKDAVLAHTDNYGIENIDYLFPDAKNVTPTPEWIKRETDWVSKVMNGTHHTPFSRIKSLFADITEDEARALGYIKGNRKKEEFFTLIRRTTDPQTIYKKQKLDRDDVIDITDFDVVAWLKAEMRIMLDEEIARAILVGDGRSPMSEDHISEEHIRPIWKDDDLFTIKQKVVVTAGSTSEQKAKAFIKAAVKARKNYRGSGTPTLYTTEDVLTDCLLIEDGIGRIIYDSESKLATALRVKEIVTVPVMENLTRVSGSDTLALMGLIVNLNDYNVGADKGGSVNMFDDFDIDYNQQKYLIETRCSGALIKPFSAIALELNFAAPLTIDPEDDDTTVLGKTVGDLQSGVIVNNNSIEGTLKYVTGYTGYSADPELQSGNFLALKFAAAEGATTTVQVLGGSGEIKTLDSDMNAVFRIERTNQKIKVVSTVDGESNERILSLGRVNLLK